MKIYNEIVIDMNPESSTFEETLHEDSYEYEGDMMLLDWTKVTDHPDYTDADGNVWTLRVNVGWFNRVKEQQIFRNGVLVKGDYAGAGTRAEAHAQFKRYIESVSTLSEGQHGGFSYSGGEFDPTSEEYKRSVQTTGGYGELAEGFGVEESDFEEFYGKPLEFAETAREMGEHSLGMQAGKSLYDIKKSTDVAMARTGFATPGTVSTASEMAKVGLFGDYKAQQEQLAFAQEQDVAAFWKADEERYYERLAAIEGLVG